MVNAARARAGRTVALIDSTKFGRASLLTIAPAQAFDTILSDERLPAATVDAYRAAGVTLQLATAAPRSIDAMADAFAPRCSSCTGNCSRPSACRPSASAAA